MIFNMNGGGAALNFKVVGGTSAPTSPAENTIWINTDTEVSGYVFSNKDPNLFDVVNWATNVGVDSGTKTLGEGSITLTATGSSYCYTSIDELSYIQCTSGKTYVIQWDYSGSEGSVQLFPNNDITNGVAAYGDIGKLEYTVPDGVTYFSFIFGVAGNKIATFSNIRITEKDCAFDPNAVWIYTGTASPVEFNALKKNCVMVYPVSVKQYVNGAWVGKVAKTYINGAWSDWTTYLYNKGNLCENITGGWQTRAWMSNYNGVSAQQPTVTYNAASVTFRNASSATKLATGVWEVMNDVDLSEVSSIKVRVLSCNVSGSFMAKELSVTGPRSNTYYTPVAVVEFNNSNSPQEYTLDVSKLAGPYNVCIFGGVREGTCIMEIESIWFVK